jgi:ATP-dependent Clp protease ATP-binding subunit ClpC
MSDTKRVANLTEKVRRRPYSVVLFDEIEKAHPDIWNILLQILEDGQITDSLGRKVDFRNTIIIMTSNVGAEFIKKNSVVGFGAASDEPDYEQIKSQLLNQAKKVFKPEFLNRLTDIIVFQKPSIASTSRKSSISRLPVSRSDSRSAASRSN